MGIKQSAFKALKTTAVATVVGGMVLVTTPGCQSGDKKCGGDKKCAGAKKCAGDKKCAADKKKDAEKKVDDAK